MVGWVFGGGLEGFVGLGGGEGFGEFCGDGELLGLRGDWRGECWGEF